MTRCLVMGEALIDVVTRPDGASAEHVGGSPANVAFGLAALDHTVDLATWFGDDTRGDAIEALCAAHGVRLTQGSRGAAHTSVALARLDPSGAATYEFDLDWRLAPVPDLAAYGHVHSGSIGAVLEPGGSAVRATMAAARASSTVSYDPNARPSLMGTAEEARRVVEEAVAVADVVKVSDEDVDWLYAARPLPEVLRLWDGLGPSLVVVTRGGEGALVRLPRRGEERALPAAPVDVVDTVGAGDSFMAGLVSGLLDGGLLGGPEARERLVEARFDDVAPAVGRALATAAVTVSRAGAHAPHRADLG